MISRIANILHVIERRWTARPLWSGALLVLLGMVLLKPWACVAYCALADQINQRSAAIEHGQHSDHAPLAPESHPDHSLPGYQPTALTVAIVLPIVLLPLMPVHVLRTPLRHITYASIAPPPLWRPPHPDHCA